MADLPPPLLEKLATLRKRRRTPVSTYRLQLHKEFGFKQAASLLDYFYELGLTDVYVSPILKAQPGSMHGYDICDHNSLNPELGTPEDFERLSQSLKQRRLGLLVDFVPNHMGNDPNTNPWWRDVLENGPSSPYAQFFDIDWNPFKPELKGKVLLPILGDLYGRVLERGELHLAFEEGSFWVRYFDTRLPVNPREAPRILKQGIEELKKTLSNEDSALREFLSIITALEHLPTPTVGAGDSMAERQREKEIARDRLLKLLAIDPVIQKHVEQAVAQFNGQAGDPKSFDELHTLLEAQAYRLAFWKTSLHEINYRRFFDINQLAGLRMEEPVVFEKTHALILKLLAEDKITSLRLDHPDGLFDPTGYYERLQEAFLKAWVRYGLESIEWTPSIDEALRDWRVSERKKEPTGLAAKPLYLVAEKILTGDEALPPFWMVDGTVGYDFLNDLIRLYIPGTSIAALKTIHERFVGRHAVFADILYDSKKLIMSTSMSSELQVLTQTLNRLSEADRNTRDYTLDSLRTALREIVACFPVYRTYINDSHASAMDRTIIAKAVAEASLRNPTTEPSIFQFIRDVLIPENADKVALKEFRRQTQFAMKVQQYTAPVQAKGMEDTAFYRYVPVMALNEVGGAADPEPFDASSFHRANTQRQASWPHTMLATSTHDTKRGEDARARLAVLAEIPDEWERQVTIFSKIAEPVRVQFEKMRAPSAYDEYSFFQSVLGAWCANPGEESRTQLANRMSAYMLKMSRESKVHTSWISPNKAYEEALETFVRQVLDGSASEAFYAAFTPFARRIAQAGAINSLSQVALKIAAPGVPDIYQGNELWNLDLVDPDNRRPVDYARREKNLIELLPFLKESRDRKTKLREWLNSWTDGRIKQFVTAAALRFRRDHAALFLEGSYQPIPAKGEGADHLIAFGRAYQGESFMVVTPRWMGSSVTETLWPEGYADSLFKSTQLTLPESFQGPYRNVWTGDTAAILEKKGERVIDAGQLLKHFPLAFLSSTSAE